MPTPEKDHICEKLVWQGWSDEMAFPILYKFTHRDSFVRFDLMDARQRRRERERERECLE